MENLFSSLLQQSLTACWVIPAVLLLRFFLRKAPKRVTNLLWLVVAFRLVCPVSFESDISLVTQARTASQAAAELMDEFRELSASEGLPTVTLPESSVTTPVPAIPKGATPAPGDPAEITVTVVPSVTEPTITVTDYRTLFYSAGCALWLAGMAALSLYGILSTFQWRRRVRTAVRGEDGIWRCETVETPFILGLFRPRIYLPFRLPEGAEDYVVAHEQAHLRRRDPLLKFLAYGLLTIYWFHPLVWVSYFLFCRDIELACDQRVTRPMDAEGKKAYSLALLACTVSRADPLLCPLSFGEVGVKARVQAILRKKPSKAFVFTALILCMLLVLCCAADPKRTESDPGLEPEVEAELIPPPPEVEPVVQGTALYSTVIGDLITQYGCFYETEQTPGLILGLKYARLHDLGGDDTPELITLVNTRDSDLRLTMTLRVYGIRDGQTVLLYETPLGGGYRQTDVSYRFAFTEGLMHNQIITYHTSDEWYEEVLHVAWFYSVNPPDVHVYRALSTDEDEEWEQFWEDGREVTLDRYGEATDPMKAIATEIDAC